MAREVQAEQTYSVKVVYNDGTKDHVHKNRTHRQACKLESDYWKDKNVVAVFIRPEK